MMAGGAKYRVRDPARDGAARLENTSIAVTTPEHTIEHSRNSPPALPGSDKADSRTCNKDMKSSLLSLGNIR